MLFVCSFKPGAKEGLYLKKKKKKRLDLLFY